MDKLLFSLLLDGAICMHVFVEGGVCFCLCVGGPTGKPCQNGRTDQDAVWVEAESCWRNEPCIRLGYIIYEHHLLNMTE